LGVKASPFIAAFSSRGPNTVAPSILKVMIDINQSLNNIIKKL